MCRMIFKFCICRYAFGADDALITVNAHTEEDAINKAKAISVTPPTVRQWGYKTVSADEFDRGSKP